MKMENVSDVYSGSGILSTVRIKVRPRRQNKGHNNKRSLRHYLRCKCNQENDPRGTISSLAARTKFLELPELSSS